MGDSDSVKLFKFVRSVANIFTVEEEEKRGGRRKMIETLISLGILGILVYIATKAEVINHNTDMIVDFLIGRGKPPLPLPVRGGNDG